MAPLTRILPAGLFLLALAASASAGVVHDPWLAAFEVGEYRQPDSTPLTASGWPAGLLAPLGVDGGWVEGATAMVEHEDLPRRRGLMAWRLAVPSLGGAEEAERAYDAARALAGRVVALAPPDAAPLDDSPPVAGAWAEDVTALQASRLWQSERWGEAVAACDRLLDGPLRDRLTESEAFVWSVRRQALRARAGGAVDLQPVWDAALDLGPYDRRSGWAVWLAVRGAHGLPPLDAEHVDRDAAVFLAGAGKLFLAPARFDDLGFAPELEAGLGAIVLPKANLDDHFARHPDIPEDGRFQGYWLAGQRRRDGSPEALERLAGLPGLKDGHRLDLWRRASEGRLLRGQWGPGLADLEQALALATSDASAWMRSRLREWAVQAVALGLAENRHEDAEHVVRMATARLAAVDLAHFREDAAPLLARLGQPRPAGDLAELRDRAENLVRDGDSPEIGARPSLKLPAPDLWRHRLWGVWAEWGLALIRARDATGSATSYRDGLEDVLAASDPDQRHASACALAAGRLRGFGDLDALLAYAWHRDIEALSGGRALPMPTPLPAVLPPAPWRTLDQRLRGHALLGAALTLGDDRGLIAAAVRLPPVGLPDAHHRLFWYPVPSDAVARQTLAGSPLPPELLLAIARNESLFEPAIRSRAGALGYMQIMPFHYDDPAAPPGDGHWSHPATSLGAGSRILAAEASAFDGDPYRAVAAYNAGRGAVRRWERQLHGVADRDLFWTWIGYPETRHYTLRVLRDREVYRWLMEPDS